MVGRDEVRDGGVDAAGEVAGEAGGKSPPRGESHGCGGGGGRRADREMVGGPEGWSPTGRGKKGGLNA